MGGDSIPGGLGMVNRRINAFVHSLAHIKGFFKLGHPAIDAGGNTGIRSFQYSVPSQS